MKNIPSLGRIGVSVLASLTLVSVLALGCRLIDGSGPDAEPTLEPDIGATVTAAMNSVVATPEAAAPTEPPKPTSNAAPITTATPAPTPAATTNDPGNLAATLSDVGPETSWGHLFAAFTEAERACITDELGEERLTQVLESPVFQDGPGQDWEPVVFGCLDQETAAALFHTMLASQMGAEVELSAESNACIHELLVDADISALVVGSGPEPTPAQAEALFGFFFGMAACAPEQMGGGPGGPPQSQPAADETRLWSYATGGWVDTAPAVEGGVVYVGSADGRVYALDAANGSELWSFATGNAVKSTPTVADGIVYVGSNDNRVYALDAATGDERWSHDTGTWMQYSPAVAEGLVYVSSLSEGDWKLHALDGMSGETVWIDTMPHHLFDDFVPSVVGGRVYVPRRDFGGYQALDAGNGQPVWTVDIPDRVESPPMVLDGVVYVTAANQAYALDESTGSVIWSYNTERFPARDFPALVIDGVYYLAPDDMVHALDAETGETIWTYLAPAPISTAPVVSDGVFFAVAEAGQIIAVDAKTGAPLWTVQADGMGLQALSVRRGVLYFESDTGYLTSVDVVDGSVIHNFQKGYIWGVGTYTVGDGVVYFGSLVGSVNAHSAPVP
jgi:outer membrane protein assembly factor BamB